MDTWWVYHVWLSVILRITIKSVILIFCYFHLEADLTPQDSHKRLTFVNLLEDQLHVS